MSAGRDVHQETGPPEKREEEESIASNLLNLLMADALADLDDIAEPSAAELAALDDLAAEDEPLEPPEAKQPPLALLNTLEEPEMVSLEGLDDADCARRRSTKNRWKRTIRWTISWKITPILTWTMMSSKTKDTTSMTMISRTIRIFTAKTAISSPPFVKAKRTTRTKATSPITMTCAKRGRR